MASTKAKRKPTPGKKSRSGEVQGGLTHPDRVVFPDDGFTKLDVATYYYQVADWFLPHASNRPLSLVRCPDGISGGCFFQKNPPRGLPGAVHEQTIPMKSGKMKAASIRDAEGLLALVQFGVIEFHAWQAKSDQIERTDRIIFDLDPDSGLSWGEVVSTANLLRELLDALGLVSFVKTSGGKGLHVVAPINRRYEWAAVKEFARAVATELVTAEPDRFTATMSKAARRGKVFIDYLRNDRGSTTVLPYSLRARATAPVSMPVEWDELKSLRGGDVFTLSNTEKRLVRLKRDPWAKLASTRQTISAKARQMLKLK